MPKKEDKMLPDLKERLKWWQKKKISNAKKNVAKVEN